MSKRRKPAEEPERTSTGETRAADAITVFWMIATMQTLILELATVALRWYCHYHPDAEQIALFSKILYLSAALTGSISLLLTPIVYRVRRVAPPNGVTVFSIVISALPVIAILLNIGL